MMTALLIVYALLGFYTACRTATYGAWFAFENQRRAYPYTYLELTDPKGENWLFGGGPGFALGLLGWPLIVIGWMARRQLAYLTEEKLFAPPKYVRAAELQERIAELEAELKL